MCKISLPVTIWLIAITALSGCVSHIEKNEYITNPYVSLGIAYLKQGNLEKARAALNQALSSNPRAPSSWGAMGYLEEISGNFTLAARDYRYAIQLAPRQGEGHNNYGIFLCRHGQQRQGIAELAAAAQLPSYIYRAAAYENAGLCALTIPDPAAARIYFQAAVRNGGHKNMAMGGLEPPTSAL